jgi:uncharacterized membrane protein YphA (DoxX/SURF4 family)
MFQTNHYSQLLLRLSLAAVFLWFGIGKCMQSQYWVDAWLPERMQGFALSIGMSSVNLVILIGILEVCIAASLVTGFFQRWFAAAGAIFLIVVMSVHGINEVLVRDIGLIGALAALAVWPERRYS